jgi:hypothetical protein
LNNKNQAPNIEEERDLELENIVGNLMIAQFQVDKLRSRLGERIGGYGSISNKKAPDIGFADPIIVVGDFILLLIPYLFILNICSCAN